MNKKLLAAAIAAAVAAPMAASAEATIYGNLHTSVGKYKAKNGLGQNEVDNWDVVGNDGQLGLKGSEDLGGSLKAIYKIELNFDTTGGALGSQCADGINSERCFDAREARGDDGASATMTWDEVWVGLTGGWGTALIGREDTPYKTFLDSPGVDILGDSIIDIDTQLQAVGAGGFERFTANGAIAYVSPNFSGFTFGGAVIPGGQIPEDPATGTTAFDGIPVKDGFADHYSVAANYIAGGLKVAVGYEKKVPVSGLSCGAGPTCDVDDQKNTGVAASYTFGDFFVGGKYEDEKNQSWSNDVDAKRWSLSGKWTFGKNAIGAVYNQEKQDTEGQGETLKAKGWGLMAEHNMSNRTKVYVAYGDAKNDTVTSGSDDTKDADAFALGVIHSF